MKKRKLPLFVVGCFLLLGLAILGWMLIKYGGSNKIKNSIEVTAEFSDASGIIEGGVVRLAGANVGYIASPPVLNENLLVDVKLALRSDLQIPKNAVFKIISLSMLGDKAIYIMHPKTPSKDTIKNGDRVIGVSPRGLDELQAEAEELTHKVGTVLEKTDKTFSEISSTLTEYKTTAEKLNVSLTRLNNSILSEESLGGVEKTLANLESSSSEIEAFSKSLAPIATETRLTVTEFMKVANETNKLVVSTNERINELSPAIKKLPETIDTYAETGKTLQDVGKTLKSAISSENSLVGALTQDGEMKSDAQTFVKNLKNNGILGYKDNSDPDKNDPRDRYRGIRR